MYSNNLFGRQYKLFKQTGWVEFIPTSALPVYKGMLPSKRIFEEPVIFVVALVANV
jgi:hypothetical protein